MSTYDSIQVKNHTDFVEFLQLLRENLARHEEEWENPTLERFLEAIAAFVEDHGELDPPRIDMKQPSWELLANIFRGAKVYE